MKLYSENNEFKLYHGSMLDMLEVISPNSIDSIVTDPPYELNFMGKGWDNSGIAFQKTTWEKCYQVLKPGGYLLAFGGTRTYHRIACAIEDAGFEIRDTIMWLYGSGFPKSMNIGLAIDKKNGVESEIIGKTIKGSSPLAGNHNGEWCDGQKDGEFFLKRANNEWAGWGTALKPAYEPIIVARKPYEGSCVDNVLQYGVGGINIDECRIKCEDLQKLKENWTKRKTSAGFGNNTIFDGGVLSFDKLNDYTPDGRFPSNVILTYDDTDFDEVCGGMPDTKSGIAVRHNSGGNTFGGNNKKPQMDDLGYLDEGSAARYFYCAKASNRDRDEGLDNFVSVKTGSMQANVNGNMQVRYASLKGEPKEIQAKKNIHPTVKPTDLMQYLVRLVTPKKGIVLDPFNGSGSTGKACMYENKDRNAEYRYIGIELTDEYLPIAEARIKFASGDNAPISIPEKPMKGQVTFFDLLEQA